MTNWKFSSLDSMTVYAPPVLPHDSFAGLQRPYGGIGSWNGSSGRSFMSTILSTFQCVRTVCDHVHGLTCAGSGVTVPTPHACVSGSHRKHDSRPHWLNVPFGHGMQPGSTSLPRQSVDACTPTEPT